MGRKVEHLLWAQAALRPQGLPIGRPRGAKAAGVRYEKAVGVALPVAKRGLWWSFEDRNGRGHCQTDLLIEGKGQILLLEVKYTENGEAWRQLEGLYRPVVQQALGKPCLCVQVCKVLNPLAGAPKARKVVTGLAEGIAAAKEGFAPVLHWIGVGQLWPPERY